MSRGGTKPAEPSARSGTPIWVWFVYGLGILGGLIIVLSALFTVGAHFLGGSGFRTSVGAFVLWGALVVVALGTWFARRKR